MIQTLKEKWYQDCVNYDIPVSPSDIEDIIEDLLATKESKEKGYDKNTLIDNIVEIIDDNSCIVLNLLVSIKLDRYMTFGDKERLTECLEQCRDEYNYDFIGEAIKTCFGENVEYNFISSDYTIEL